MIFYGKQGYGQIKVNRMRGTVLTRYCAGIFSRTEALRDLRLGKISERALRKRLARGLHCITNTGEDIVR